MTGMSALLPPLAQPPDKTAVAFGERELTYRELVAASAALARQLRELPRGAAPPRVAVWASPELETVVAVVGALLAGIPVVPLNPKLGSRELDHIVADSAPMAVLAAPGTELPTPLAALAGISVHTTAQGSTGIPDEPDAESAALIVYTSGTTGAPKGVVLSRRAIAANLDGLADAWAWTGRDVLTHALPLYHVHGLILGVLGPLRRGGTLHHLSRFSVEGVGRELAGAATMLFGVPTMYHRIADALTGSAGDAGLARALSRARLLVSGSAALPVAVHQRITAATGQQVVERYGLTETLINTSVRADGERRPGTVGVPLPGVELRLVDQEGTVLTSSDGDAIGEIQIRGANLFTEYLNRQDATAEAHIDGWFGTGDLATTDPDGYLRIVGRKTTDLISSGGYRIGAGEIENALLEHPAVTEVAVTGEPDPDLGERIVAWVVPAGAPPAEDELVEHVATLLSPHKRPRVIRFLDALPRNDMGKVLKRQLSH